MIPTLKSDDGFEDTLLIVCPICGGNYSHIKDPDGWGSRWSGRGPCTRIRFEGECGHCWNLCIGHHKGENFLFMEALRP